MHGYLSADIICSKMRTVFRERSSRRFMWFEEQIMSKEQYTRIISLIVEAFVVIILQVLCNACEKNVYKQGTAAGVGCFVFYSLVRLNEQTILSLLQ